MTRTKKQRPSNPAVITNPLDSKRKAASRRRSAFKGTQFAKKVVTTAIGGTAAVTGMLNTVGSSDGPFHPGSDRWSIKTSAQSTGPLATPKHIEIKALENLVNLDISNKGDFSSSLIPNVVAGGFQEGQIVTTEGYVHLVAFESDDSDYHIQLNDKATNDLSDLEPCVVIETPHPQATQDPTLSADFAKVRKFLRDNCFGGNPPSGKVDVPIHVRVTGQLFFDLHHSTKGDAGGGRGKSLGKGLPMHATTLWEIHPITSMELISSPP